MTSGSSTPEPSGSSEQEPTGSSTSESADPTEQAAAIDGSGDPAGDSSAADAGSGADGGATTGSATPGSWSGTGSFDQGSSYSAFLERGGLPDGYTQQPYGEQGYGEQGYGQPEYAQPGYAHSGFAPQGYAQPGYPPPGHAQPGYAPAYSPSAYAAGASAVATADSPTEFWLEPGPPLPLRTWQRNTRIWVIVGSTIGAIVLALVAVLALGVGALSSSVIVARGEVVVDCQNRTAQTASGTIREGARVQIFDDAGARVDDTRLAGFTRDGDTCTLGFDVEGMRSIGGEYVVQIDNVFSQPVSGQSLQSGVVLRPIG